MAANEQGDAGVPLRAAVYARLSETYDAAESVPTQLASAQRHAAQRGWRVAARFKDDGYSAFKEIRRDDFVNLVDYISLIARSGLPAGRPGCQSCVPGLTRARLPGLS